MNVLKKLIHYFSERKRLREMYSRVVGKPAFERELQRLEKGES